MQYGVEFALQNISLPANTMALFPPHEKNHSGVRNSIQRVVQPESCVFTHSEPASHAFHPELLLGLNHPLALYLMDVTVPPKSRGAKGVKYTYAMGLLQVLIIHCL